MFEGIREKPKADKTGGDEILEASWYTRADPHNMLFPEGTSQFTHEGLQLKWKATVTGHRRQKTESLNKWKNLPERKKTEGAPKSAQKFTSNLQLTPKYTCTG